MLKRPFDVVTQLAHVYTKEQLVKHAEVSAVLLVCSFNCFAIVCLQQDV